MNKKKLDTKQCSVKINGKYDPIQTGCSINNQMLLKAIIKKMTTLLATEKGIKIVLIKMLCYMFRKPL